MKGVLYYFGCPSAVVLLSRRVFIFFFKGVLTVLCVTYIFIDMTQRKDSSALTRTNPAARVKTLKFVSSVPLISASNQVCIYSLVLLKVQSTIHTFLLFGGFIMDISLSIVKAFPLNIPCLSDLLYIFKLC